MNILSWRSAFFVVIALFSVAMAAQSESNAIRTGRVRRGLFGPAFGFGLKSSILESKFGKGGFPFAPQLVVQPAAQPAQPGALPAQPGALPAAQPGVAQPPAIIPTFLENILKAKMDIVSGKFAAKQPLPGSFGNVVPPGSLTLEDIELAEEYVDPATASKNNILASILKLSGPLSSSSSVEDIDE